MQLSVVIEDIIEDFKTILTSPSVSEQVKRTIFIFFIFIFNCKKHYL